MYPLLPDDESPLAFAKRRRIPTMWVDKMVEDQIAPIRALAPDLILVGGFGIILKRPFLEIPRLGCVNVHSSLLPAHRGPNPFSAAILAGDTESGVTFHVIDEGVDTGGIVRQFPFPLEPADTQFGVYGRACDVARENVVAVLDEIEGNGLNSVPQDLSGGSYDKKLTHADVEIRWDMSAAHIDRLVRASTPTLYPWFMCSGRKVRVGRVKFDPAPVDAAPGTLLARKPVPVIATGCGRVMLEMVFVLSPIPVLWPEPWRHIRPGMKVG